MLFHDCVLGILRQQFVLFVAFQPFTKSLDLRLLPYCTFTPTYSCTIPAKLGSCAQTISRAALIDVACWWH